MNEPTSNLHSVDYEAKQSKQSTETPEFGLLDVIEAFTAVRHESRGQQKESRELAASLESAVVKIQTLESKLLAATEIPPDTGRDLAELVVETDIQLTRAVDALNQESDVRRQRAEADRQRVLDAYEGLGRWSRWFAKPLWDVVEQVLKPESTQDQPLVDGVNIVLTKLRRLMEGCQLERLDMIGKRFDPESMNAIDTIASDKVSAGHVTEQLTPCYRWRGKLIRYAQVRIAK